MVNTLQHRYHYGSFTGYDFGFAMARTGDDQRFRGRRFFVARCGNDDQQQYTGNDGNDRRHRQPCRH